MQASFKSQYKCSVRHHVVLVVEEGECVRPSSPSLGECWHNLASYLVSKEDVELLSDREDFVLLLGKDAISSALKKGIALILSVD